MIGISLISLFFLWIATYWFKTFKINSKRKKNIFLIILTLLISSKFYYSYSTDIIHRITSDKRIMINSIESKIQKNIEKYPYSLSAQKLILEEYEEIIKRNKGFPKIQKEAEDISYKYSYDGFLPDYTFRLSFQIPLNTKLDSTHLKFGKISLDTINYKIKVNYLEIKD
ncbi:hypothetical protein [Aureivirga marina]|uniref:hypothetical protein n=1 Tax=Aureivirga marina TaxID=1182451 RepID=UPI0018CA3314|nr:hypothetical protein [Aureivirga marina]